MSSTFKIGVESKEQTKQQFKTEAEALENTFKKKEGSKFENSPLTNLNELIDILSEDFKQQLTKTVNSQPDPETKKRPSFIHDGYRYGVTYSEQFETFSVWRMKVEGSGYSSGSGQYRQKATVFYNLQQIYEGEVDTINDYLDQFNAKKERYDQVSLVNVFPNKDGKLIYVLKKDKVVILGQNDQQQQQQQTQTSTEAKPQQ